MKKIYHILLLANESGIKAKLIERDYKETDKNYIISGDLGWKPGAKHLKKDELFKVTSGITRDDMYRSFYASIWFLEDQKKEAVNMALEYLRQGIQDRYDVAVKMTEHFNNFIINKNER